MGFGGESAGCFEILTPQLVTAAELSAYDVLLVSVKASGLEQALDDAAPAVGPRTAVIPFLNGMAHLDTLNARFGKESVLSGVVKVATTVNENGDIVRLAPLSSFAFGEQNGQPPLRTRDLSALLDVEGYALSVPPDIVAAMWHNWVFIAGVGAVTCLMRGTVGDVVAVEDGADWQHDHAQAFPANHDMKPCDHRVQSFLTWSRRPLRGRSASCPMPRPSSRGACGWRRSPRLGDAVAFARPRCHPSVRRASLARRNRC